MDGAKILKLALFLVFLVVHPRTNSQWVPRPIAPQPLCVSQFALANHACAFLPYVPGPPPSPPPPSPTGLDDKHEHENEHTHEHEHEHEHKQKHEHEHEQMHRHGHRHRRHRHGLTPVEEDCCRWLNAIDSECVCDLLVHLPPFLSRPVHQYTVLVQDSCNVTYQCGSRIST